MNDNERTLRLTARQVLGWSFLAGVGFTLAAELTAAPFRILQYWILAQLGQ